MKTNKSIVRFVCISLILTLFTGVISFPLHAAPAAAPDPANKVCEWGVENTFVFPAKLTDGDRKALDKLLDALVSALGAASAEVKAVTKAIDKLGPGGDVVDVIVVYACTDDEGNIHRKKVELDGLTETVHWAAKTGLLTGAAKKDNDRDRENIINKHRPTGSCCKAKPKEDPKTTTPKARPEIPGANNGRFPDGLFIQEFPTQFGKIKVNLPDDIAAGDTISGTVVTEPSGGTVEERDANQGELNGYVVDVEKQRTGTGHWGKWLIPAAATAITLVLLDRRGKEVSRENVPVGTSDWPRNGGPRQPGDFQLPKEGQTGRNVAARGPFDGDLSRTGVTIGGKPVTILAESPRKAVFASPRDVVGATEIEVREGNVVVRGQYRNIAMNLVAGKLELRRGEKTNLNVTVRGLQGLQHPVSVRLINHSSRIVSMQGGEDQDFTISQTAVGDDGSYTKTLDLTGVSAGNFQITGNLLSDNEGLIDTPAEALIKAWYRARKAKRAAEEAKKKAAAAQAAADKARETADRAKRQGSSDANQKDSEAKEKEKESGAAKGDADSAQGEADTAQSDLDRQEKNLPGSSEKAYRQEADKADADAKDARDEADRLKNDIEKDGNKPDDPRRADQQKAEEKAQEREQDAKDLRKSADAARVH